MFEAIVEVVIKVCCAALCEACIQCLCNEKKIKDDEKPIVITDDQKVFKLDRLNSCIYS